MKVFPEGFVMTNYHFKSLCIPGWLKHTCSSRKISVFSLTTALSLQLTPSPIAPHKTIHSVHHTSDQLERVCQTCYSNGLFRMLFNATRRGQIDGQYYWLNNPVDASVEADCHWIWRLVRRCGLFGNSTGILISPASNGRFLDLNKQLVLMEASSRDALYDVVCGELRQAISIWIDIATAIQMAIKSAN